MKTLKNILIQLNACEDAVEWVADKSIEQAVKECPRGDWMIWLAAKLEIDQRKLTLAKGHCANTVRHLMKDERSIKAVNTAIAYGEGKATKEQLRAAYIASSAAADAASYAAAYAAGNSVAYVAAYVPGYAAAYAAANAANAAGNSVAYVAAYAAAYAAYAYAAINAAEKSNQLKTADICRKYIGQDIIDKVKEALK